MTEPQEFSSDFDRWVCSLLDMLRAKGYYNVSVNRGREQYTFFMSNPSLLVKNKLLAGFMDVKLTQLQTDFKNNQTPQQILYLIK